MSRDKMEGKVPGKLRARPVQHPATPALITVKKKKKRKTK